MRCSSACSVNGVITVLLNLHSIRMRAGGGEQWPPPQSGLEEKSWIKPHRQAGLRHINLRLAHRMLAEMEDRCRKHRACMPVANALDQVVKRSHPAGCNDRHGHGVGYGTGKRKIKPLPGAVTIHGSEQYFSCPERGYLARIVDGIEAGGIASAMGKNLPPVAFARPRHALGVDRNDDALIAEFFRCLL